MSSAEIIAIGNELLAGDVQDTNTHWLCRQITGLGGRVTRAAVIGDDASAIAGEVRQALARQPSLIFTAGGLGPTADDMTLAAVAQAIGRPLELSDAALALVQAAYERFAAQGYVADAAMTESRRKMAMLPSGAQPLPNPVGAAPGVLLMVQAQTLVSLPGVPQELQGIFSGSLAPTLHRVFGSSAFAEQILVADCGDESVLAPLLADVAARHPHAYIKSRPRRFGPDIRIRITISARADCLDDARQRLDNAAAAVRQALKSYNITTAE
jgi:molybdenum cofactor synthesis domain-containing protein